jgi:hypothetical protein
MAFSTLVFDLGVRGAGGVAEQDYDGAPGDAAGGVVGEESGIGHPGGAGEGGHDGAEERDPSAKLCQQQFAAYAEQVYSAAGGRPQV